MKSLYALLFMFTFSVINAQDAIGFLIDENGKEINLFKKQSDKIDIKYNHILNDDVNLTGQFIYYFNNSGDLKKISQSEVKEMSYNGHVFKNLPITKLGTKRLHEIILENDKYVLTSYFFLVNYFYVFEKETYKMVETKTKHSKKRKQDYKSLDKTIKKYFSECSGLMEKVSANIKNGDYKILYGNTAIVKNIMFNGFANYKCE